MRHFNTEDNLLEVFAWTGFTVEVEFLLNSHNEHSVTHTKHIHDHSRHWLGTCTSIKYVWFKLVL